MKLRKLAAFSLAFTCASTLCSGMVTSAATVTDDYSAFLIPIDYSEYGLGCNIDDNILDSNDEVQTDTMNVPYERDTSLSNTKGNKKIKKGYEGGPEETLRHKKI